MYQIKIQCEKNMYCISEPFSKVIIINDDYEYSNIWRKIWLLYIICICVCAISWFQIYSDIRLVNMWHLIIFKYFFGKFCGIQIYSDSSSGPFLFAHHWAIQPSVEMFFIQKPHHCPVTILLNRWGPDCNWSTT